MQQWVGVGLWRNNFVMIFSWFRAIYLSVLEVYVIFLVDFSLIYVCIGYVFVGSVGKGWLWFLVCVMLVFYFLFGYPFNPSDSKC